MLQIQSPETLARNFVQAIPISYGDHVITRRAPSVEGMCIACMRRLVATVISIRRRMDGESYPICVVCHSIHQHYQNSNWYNMPACALSSLPSPDQHLTAMNNCKFINIIKIAIGIICLKDNAMGDNALRPINDTTWCVGCIINTAAMSACSMLCLRCHEIMRKISNCIRGVVITWACANLPLDCNNVIIGKYVELLLLPDV